MVMVMVIDDDDNGDHYGELGVAAQVCISSNVASWADA